MKASRYGGEFFRWQAASTATSASVIVPMLLERSQASSVVDLGCGTGTWLSAFRSAGVTDVLGVDGPWVPTGELEIPETSFLVADLTRPPELGRRFDLALSLEVAEPLPESAAATFVDTLTRCAPVVVFSAAIPLQGGRNHWNEQWPSYWAGLFEARGWVVVDWIRERVWRNESVEWYYAQNLLTFCEASVAGEGSPWYEDRLSTSREMLDVVHPRHYARSKNLDTLGIRKTLGAIPGMVWRSLVRRSRRRLARESSGAAGAR